MPQSFIPETFNPFAFPVKIGGHIYKGSRKIPYRKKNGEIGKRIGSNLSQHGFRLEFHDEAAERLFKRFYFQEIVEMEDGAIVVPKVNVYFPFQQLHYNYVVAYGNYNQGGGFQHLCTGQTIIRKKVRRQREPDRFGNPQYSWPVEQVSEPCPNRGSSLKCPDCQHIRRLTVYIAEMYDAGYRSRAFVLNSPAANEAGLFYELQQIERMLINMGANICEMPNSVASVPETDHRIRWILSRSPENIGVPQTEKRGNYVVQTGKQTQKEEWLLSMHICPEWWQTAMARVGKGPYRLNELGQPVCIMEERLGYMQAFAEAAQKLAAAGASINQYLPGTMAMPQLAPGPAEVIDAEEVVGPGISLAGDEPIPGLVREALGIEEAPFAPKDGSNGKNATLFRQVAGLLAITDGQIASAINARFPGRHSSELRPIHCEKVVDRMLIDWSLSQVISEGIPVFNSHEEAQQFMLEQRNIPKAAAKRTQWWIELITQRKSGQV